MCENLPYESVHFKELHNEQECYWPTIYWAGAAVVSTITSFIEDKTKYVLVTRRAFCGHFCLLVPGYNLNFRFLRTWSIYFFVFVVFVCMGVRMDKMSAKSLIICQHIINSIQERFVGQAKSSNCFYVYGFESNQAWNQTTNLLSSSPKIVPGVVNQ